MTSHVVTPLGKEAAEYMRSSLRNGLTLARLLRTHVDFDSGYITTVFDPHIDSSKAMDFGSGWNLDQDEARRYLMYLAEQLDPGSGSLLWLVEDVSAEPHFPYLQRTEAKGIPIRSLNEEVYYVLSRNHHNRAMIQEAMKLADACYYSLSVVAPSEAPGDLHGLRGAVSVDFLRGVAERAELVAMSAYDGEGLVIWQRNPTLSVTWPPQE
jgi:hypothetical protein